MVRVYPCFIRGFKFRSKSPVVREKKCFNLMS
jgi:hypothetical protein